MVVIIIERLALLSALSALVLALFWPHIGPKLLPYTKNFLKNPFSANINRKVISIDEHSSKQDVLREHPKFSGGSLRRMTSDKESIYSAYRSMEGFGQTPLTSGPSFAMPSIVPSPPAAGRGGGHSSYRHLSQQAGGGQSSTMSLTIFTATMMALIVYSLMKMLNSRFSGHNSGRGCDGAGKVNRRAPTSRWSGSNYHYDRVNMETRDLRQDRRHRKFARMSRDERARELILHHGGRNVSSAIRFLVGELEKQKHLLFKNLSDNDLTCNCSCHADYVSSDLPSLSSEHKSLDELSDEGGQQQELLKQQQQQQEGTTPTSIVPKSDTRITPISKESRN